MTLISFVIRGIGPNCCNRLTPRESEALRQCLGAVFPSLDLQYTKKAAAAIAAISAKVADFRDVLAHGENMFRRNDQESNSRVDELSISGNAVQKLRALARGLESVSPLDKQNATSRRRRLLKVREGIASITKQLARPYCNCRFSTEVDIEHTEKFETEMNVSCPIHGPGRLGVLMIILVDRPDPRKARLEQLIQEYDRRWRLWKAGQK